MKVDFVDWLQKELDKRNWNRSELVRQARAKGHKLTTSQVSRVMTREQIGTVEVIMAIASALDLPSEDVFRVRGWLSDSAIKVDPRAQLLAKEVSALPSVSRNAALNAMESMLDSIRELTSEIPEFSANGQQT